MHVALSPQFRSFRIPPTFPARLRTAACCGALLAFSPVVAHAAAASGGDVIVVDPAMIASLQLRAQQAPPREKVQLFADLADKISLLATKQIADGDEAQAQVTLQQLEACTADIENAMQDNSKGLKKTEMMLHTTNRRLKDLVRGASGDMKPVVQAALKRLDQAQTTLLSAVFSK